MTFILITTDGKPQIKRVEAFCTLRDGNLPTKDELFSDILDSMDYEVKKINSRVTQGALNNCHGDWYEWLLATTAWNYRIEQKKDVFILLLPNIKQFDVARLYNDKLYEHIVDLREKVKNSSDVELVTSNPDYVIINSTGIDIDIDIEKTFSNKICEFNKKNIYLLENFYREFISKCSFENIVGYLSVKTSFRPDRRLQIAHEGSLMKAIYIHLQTREWIIKPKGLKYYAASIKATDADIKGLKTVATHSITSVQSLPQAAVDEVFIINSLQEAESSFDKMLQLR